MVSAGRRPGAGFVAAIGNFDGVHLGHQYLLEETKILAGDVGALPGVVVFDPHPRFYFKPDDPPFLLTAPAQRDALLHAHGAQKIFALPFNDAMSSLAPEDFVRNILKDRLGLAGVATGSEFRFGAERAGDAAALEQFGQAAGLAVKIVNPLSESPDTEKFGSSLVRNALRGGDVKSAARMLGRPWIARGVVEAGEKRGRTIGFPTANLRLGPLVEPRYGVYAVRIKCDFGKFDGVANFGRRPTVGGDAPLLEAHLFGFDGDLYDTTIEVTFINFIRDEQRFDGLEALKAQIQRDCEAARSMLA